MAKVVEIVMAEVIEVVVAKVIETTSTTTVGITATGTATETAGITIRGLGGEPAWRPASWRRQFLGRRAITPTRIRITWSRRPW